MAVKEKEKVEQTTGSPASHTHFITINSHSDISAFLIITNLLFKIKNVAENLYHI